MVDEPYKSYIKRILGKVYVRTLNPFSGSEDGALLVGDPRKPDDDCIIDMWTEKEDQFFRKSNKRHFETGTLVEYTRVEHVETEEEKTNKMSEEKMKAILSDRFFTIQNAVAKFTAVPPLYIMLGVAKEMEKSDKILKLIEARISELQAKEYGQKETEE